MLNVGKSIKNNSKETKLHQNLIALRNIGLIKGRCIKVIWATIIGAGSENHLEISELIKATVDE